MIFQGGFESTYHVLVVLIVMLWSRGASDGLRMRGLSSDGRSERTQTALTLDRDRLQARQSSLRRADDGQCQRENMRGARRYVHTCFASGEVLAL